VVSAPFKVERSRFPALTALLAAATKYSGYMAMGLIGYPAVDRPQ